MAAEILDLQHLSSYCSLPQDTFQSLLDAPTVDLVKRLLQVVTEKAREHEKAKSENLKLSVELENAVRGAEAKTRVLKSSVEKGLKEAAELRQKLQLEGTLHVWMRDRACRLTSPRTIKNKSRE